MNTQEVQLTLDNLDILLNDYHIDIIKTVLLNDVYDKIMYIYRPRRMSIYKFVGREGHHDKHIREIAYKGLTYFRVYFLMFEHQKEGVFDNFAKERLQKRAST